MVADFLLGVTGNYQQISSFPTNDLKFHQWSLYAQDSFKANRQLTLNYGLRFDHVGQWYGTPEGFQVWNPATYTNNIWTPERRATNTGSALAPITAASRSVGHAFAALLL